jgi:recombination protein RecA
MSVAAELSALLAPAHPPGRAKALPLSLDRRAPDSRADSSRADSSRAPDSRASSLDAALPDGGLPRGAVIELTAARGLGRVTTIALRACAAAQAEARLRSGDPTTHGAWCAFLDPWSTLHAPGLADSGVDPTRLLVVRSPESALARVAVRVAESRAFALIVVDTAGVPGVELQAAGPQGTGRVRLDRWGTVVRRLALAVERTDTAVLLVTDALAPRSMPLPVAMRLELEQRDRLTLRVAKDRHGRVGAPIAVAL